MNNITLRQFCAERFGPYLKTTSFSDTTKQRYVDRILKCNDSLLDLPMACVTDSIAKETLEWLKNEKKYAATTVNYTRYALRCCWRLAIEDNVVSSNPFLNTKRAPLEDPHQYFTDDELKKLEQVIPYYYEPELFLTALYTPLKKNYIFGLLIADIPDDGAVLTILHSGAIYPGSRRFCLTDFPSPIEYELNSKAMACLRKAKQTQLRLKARHGSDFNSMNLLFPDKFGHPYLAPRIDEFLDLIREASGVYQFSFLEIYAHNQKYGGLSTID